MFQNKAVFVFNEAKLHFVRKTGTPRIGRTGLTERDHIDSVHVGIAD